MQPSKIRTSSLIKSKLDLSKIELLLKIKTIQQTRKYLRPTEVKIGQYFFKKTEKIGISISGRLPDQRGVRVQRRVALDAERSGEAGFRVYWGKVRLCRLGLVR